jgi:hypothetical protein
MALTFTEVKRINMKNAGGIREAIYDITFDASYVTGGWAIAAADFKMTALYGLQPMGSQVAAAGVAYGYDPLNSKLLAWKSNGTSLMAEIAASDLSTRSARFRVTGG